VRPPLRAGWGLGGSPPRFAGRACGPSKGGSSGHRDHAIHTEGESMDVVLAVLPLVVFYLWAPGLLVMH
jgi:hypothetical protein